MQRSQRKKKRRRKRRRKRNSPHIFLPSHSPLSRPSIPSSANMPGIALLGAGIFAKTGESYLFIFYFLPEIRDHQLTGLQKNTFRPSRRPRASTCWPSIPGRRHPPTPWPLWLPRMSPSPSPRSTTTTARPAPMASTLSSPAMTLPPSSSACPSSRSRTSSARPWPRASTS